MASTVYEPIMTALYGRLQTYCAVGNGGLFSTVTRYFRTWEALIQDIQSGASPLSQPALILYDGIGFGGGKTKYEQRGRGRPPVRVLMRTIVCYATLPGGTTAPGPDGTTSGGAVFAPLVENIEAAFAPDSEGALTLGGLVSHCWIEGESHWITGEIDPGGQGMFTIPVHIMVP
jgi:hypothetical protein